MSMVVYDPDKEKGSRLRRALPILSALAFVSFVAAAVVAVFTLGWLRADIPENLAFQQAAPEEVTVIEDQTLEVELDEDGAAQEISVESIDGPATVEIEDTTLVIEPDENAVGTVTVEVTVCTDEACTERTIVADVMSRNDPPRANSDEAELASGQQIIRIPVLENDSDVEDTTLQIVEAAVAQGGGEVEIVENGTVIEFRTNPEIAGPWEITYVIADGDGGFAQGRVTIDDGDAPPQPSDDQFETLLAQRIRVAPLGNDFDDGGTEDLRIVEVSEPATGSVEFGDDWVEFLAANEPGATAITYVVSDVKGQRASATITFDVAAPQLVLVDDVATTLEDTSVVVDVLANDGPANAAIDPTTLTLVSASSGTVSVGGGQITYDPPANAAGEANIIYEVCTEFSECAQAVLVVTVEGVIDGSFSSDGEIRLPANAGPQLIPWLAVSSGEAVPPAGSRFQISTDDTSLFSANPSIDANGAMSFTPRRRASGTAVTRITATDPVNGQRVFVIRIVVT